MISVTTVDLAKKHDILEDINEDRQNKNKFHQKSFW